MEKNLLWLRWKALGNASAATWPWDGVSFRMAPREIYSYLGPKAAGKITTIRILMGLTRCSGGNV